MSMTPSPAAARAAVHPVRPHEVRQLAAVLAGAFAADPVAEYVTPSAAGRPARMERFFHDLVLTRLTLPFGHVYTTADIAGGALWLPPGEAHASVWEQVRMLPLIARLMGRDTPRALRAMAAMEKVHPREPHWYLWFAGVRPERQGEGISTALVRPILDRCDAESMPAYLEATNEHSRDLAARQGFEVTGLLELPDGGPTLWLMWRP